MKNMRITLTLMVVLFALGCTSTAIQSPTAASTEARMTVEVSHTPTSDWLALHSTERAATVFALQTASATPLPTHLPTETLTPPPTLTPAPRLLSPQGPWLLYLRNIPRPAMMDLAEVPSEFVLLNQDGSGRTSVTLSCSRDVNAFLMDSGNSANYITPYAGGLYLFRPSEATGMVIFGINEGSPACQTYFNGDEKGGLLASFYQTSKDVSPELILYELPSGKIHERFPLVRCSKDTGVCEKFRSNWPEMMHQQLQWSPNGRYLAFVAILDATSSDLFIYDTQTGNLRRLTNGPDWVGPLEWSPDGTQIIMQEILNDGEFFFDPYSKPPTSVWSVSVSTSEIKLLYSIEDAYTIQNILLWLDDQRFIAYEGFLVNADQARDLRLVDTKIGTNRILFNGVFVMISFDPVHEVFAIYEQNTEKCLPTSICLVSMKDGTIRPVTDIPDYYLSFPRWDKSTGLFVSGSDCENDSQGLQAFNYQGTFRCVPKPVPTPTQLETARYPAPNGKWSISVKDGLWLETASKPAVLVSQETASAVIWCPDSSCFFFSVLQPNHSWNLYHISLPDLTVKLVDEGLESRGTYQWLGVEQ
jgi:WD40 repeat protein